MVGLYPHILNQAGLSALKEALGNKSAKNISTETLIQMTEFVLKNNFFEFNNKVFQQISGTVIGTKFPPPYVCIYMEELSKIH